MSESMKTKIFLTLIALSTALSAYANIGTPTRSPVNGMGLQLGLKSIQSMGVLKLCGTSPDMATAGLM
jgi:hypothetical protein